MTGFVSSMRVGPIGPSPSRCTVFPASSLIAFRSAPAQKVPFAPVSTATSCAVVGVERAERIGERRGRRAVDGVAPLGAIDGDDRDAVDVFDDDAHAGSLRPSRCPRSLIDATERTPVRDATMRDSDV